MELTDLRQRVNLEPQAVAEKLRVAESTVRNWESGRTTPRLNIDQFHHLCEIYGCSFDELYAAFRATKARTGKHREVATHSRTLSALRAAGWDVYPHVLEIQKIFTAGRIEVQDNSPRRLPKKCVDFLLYYTQDFPIAVVEVKAEHRSATNGLEEAKHYAATLGVKFAYSTNGREIIEFDFTTGTVRECNSFPTPNELWARQKAGEKLNDEVAKCLLAPSNHLIGYQPRYYQEAAINRAVQSILQNQHRILLTMAPGTGKTFVAFQICWKLWSAYWNRTGDHRRPRILFLADRNAHINQSIKTLFTAFGDAYWKISSDEVEKGRNIYLATYQKLLSVRNNHRLYQNYSPGFFDLIIVDDCHRGSARSGSTWREILEYFELAYQIGLTAIPKQDSNADTLCHFDNLVYTYSLRQGIEDGFLAPVLIHKIRTSLHRWHRDFEKLDSYEHAISDEDYQIHNLETKLLLLENQTWEFAQDLSEFMKQSDRFAKTIVFCRDELHAEEMLFALSNINADLVEKYPDYICRVTGATGQYGQDNLRRFQDVETKTPVILTTSKMLVTGVDVPTCKNLVLARPISSKTEFMQIIGQGLRVREDCGKFYCNIIDYTDSTRLFCDLEFDGKSEKFFEEKLNEVSKLPTKHYSGNIYGNRVRDNSKKYNTDKNPQQQQTISGYLREEFHRLYRSASELRKLWNNPQQRAEIISQLGGRGLTSDDLKFVSNRSDTDLIDILCHITFDEPILTRQQRIERLRTEENNFWEQYKPAARSILNEVLNKYAEYGDSQLALPGVLKIPPISNYGNIAEIAQLFGGLDKLQNSIHQLQKLLYKI